MQNPTWSISKSGSKDEVIAHVLEQLGDEGAQGAAKAFLLSALALVSMSHCSVSSGGHLQNVSASVTQWDEPKAA